MSVSTKTITTTTTTLYINEGEDDEIQLELDQEPDDYFDPVVEELATGGHVVGYLVHDDDCMHPLDDCDGMGKILDGRRGYRTSDKYWAKREDFDEVLDVLLDVYSHSGDVWRIHGGGKYFPDEQWDVSNGAGIWSPDECCEEHIATTAAEAYLCPDPVVQERRAWARSDAYPKPDYPARKEAPLINFTTKLHSEDTGEKYDNGNAKSRYWTTYGWQHQDGRKRSGYKTVLAAVKAAAKALGVEFDKAKYDAERREEALVCAYQAVREYNKWLSGDCWGVCVETFDKDHEPVEQDAVWGFVGKEYAEEEVHSRVQQEKATAVKTQSQVLGG
jgi:hypothetical protein